MDTFVDDKSQEIIAALDQYNIKQILQIN